MTARATNAATTRTSSTMKAVTRTGWMGMTRTFNEAYEYDFPVPASSSINANHTTNDDDLKDPTTVLVKVIAAGLNPADYKVPRLVFGPVYGLDLCGVVVKVGSQVNDVRREYQQEQQQQQQQSQHAPDGCAPLKVGDVVTGCPVKFRHGSLCEYTISPALGVCHVQPDWSIAENAGLNVVCCTFMTALEDAGLRMTSLLSSSSSESTTKTTSRKPFGSILILGSSGGCGSVAVQICKGIGIERIVGVCSTKNFDLCTRLGATEVVCYDDVASMDEFCRNPNNINSFDVVYDTVSDGSSSSSSSNGDYLYDTKIRALAKPTNPIDSSKPNYLTLNASPYGWLRTMVLGWSPTSGSPRTHIVQARYSCDKLSSAIHFMTVAEQRPVVDETIGISPFTAESVEDAYKKLKSRRTRGKLIIRICDEGK